MNRYQFGQAELKQEGTTVFITDFGHVIASEPFVKRLNEIEKYRVSLKRKKKSQRPAIEQLRKVEKAVSEITEVYWRAGELLKEI